MPGPIHDSVREHAKSIWFSLAPRERTASNVIAGLKRIDHDVSKGTVNRWASDWRKMSADEIKAEEAKVERTEPVRKPGKDYEIVRAAEVEFGLPTPDVLTDDDLREIPMSLRDMFGVGLYRMTKGKGLDRMEEFAVAVLNAVQEQLPRAAEMLLDDGAEAHVVPIGDDETKVVVVEKSKLAKALFTIGPMYAGVIESVYNARLKGSIYGRNVGEFDMLSGAGTKHRAEAEVLRNGLRADAAKDITPSGATPDQARTALEILSGHATRK